MLAFVVLALIPYLVIAFAIGRVLGAADDQRDRERTEAGLPPYEDVPGPVVTSAGEPQPAPISRILPHR
ncbi:hypothetical protein HL653_14130 [Sphingomonas sp. AP4-R1]|uniref:hypothetical protein n=1 Tax=Sphingomonas sp. AP4-R1 TaxID=2735134 RepID=UPI0014937493|nr:hypothetical protein [Sphingomonas sp. AP4-R1]QJU58753.1 hypothetical protein HL653_14130 [Sphingomonas sp. AP4-R1]